MFKPVITFPDITSQRVELLERPPKPGEPAAILFDPDILPLGTNASEVALNTGRLQRVASSLGTRAIIFERAPENSVKDGIPILQDPVIRAVASSPLDDRFRALLRDSQAEEARHRRDGIFPHDATDQYSEAVTVEIHPDYLINSTALRLIEQGNTDEIIPSSVEAQPIAKELDNYMRMMLRIHNTSRNQLMYPGDLRKYLKFDITTLNGLINALGLAVQQGIDTPEVELLSRVQAFAAVAGILTLGAPIAHRRIVARREPSIDVRQRVINPLIVPRLKTSALLRAGSLVSHKPTASL